MNLQTPLFDGLEILVWPSGVLGPRDVFGRHRTDLCPIGGEYIVHVDLGGLLEERERLYKDRQHYEATAVLLSSLLLADGPAPTIGSLQFYRPPWNQYVPLPKKQFGSNEGSNR